jgi:hypothetical protein
MSLVNDALKRATETQKNVGPAPGNYLPLRREEPAQQRKRGIGIVWPAILAVILVAAIFSIVLVNQKNRSTPVQLPTPTQTATMASPIAATAPPPALTQDSAIAPTKGTVATNSPAPVVEAASPKPAPLKLQAVFFTPPRSLAIINGQRVYVGDSVRELQVVAIGSTSATLIGPNQTNFLTLE